MAKRQTPLTGPEIYEKLTSYCAYSERCPSDVKTKMYSLKIDKSEMDGYLSKLQDQNFLNEERFVKYFVSAHTKKKWGKTKIKSALSRKGLNSSLIKKYLDEIEEDDYEDQIKVLVQKKLKSLRTGTARDKKNKLVRFLLGKGFEMGKIVPALKDLVI